MANCSPYRLCEAGVRLPWLGALLEAYAVLDAGIADILALPREAQRRAFARLLPHYEAGGATFGDRVVLEDTHVLQGLDWSGLAGALACK